VQSPRKATAPKIVRIAFAGFRHGHIMEVYQFAGKHAQCCVAGAAEDHAETAASVQKQGVTLTHASVDALLADPGAFDALAIGDYYGRRGNLAIRALELGKHVILDKPICTRLDECERMAQLSARNGLSVGCQLSLRDMAPTRTLKRLVAEGIIGRVHTVLFTGQHPLSYGVRPAWYFEDGKHGGTINDIGIHGIDFVTWMLGRKWAEVLAARVWNSSLPQCPPFNVGAQMLLRLDDQAGVLGDVSYYAPASQGYSTPQYWRFTLHGDKGVLETSATLKDVTVWRDGAKAAETLPFDPPRARGYFEDFVAEATGRAAECELTTAQVLESARATLLVQQAADRRLTNQPLG